MSGRALFVAACLVLLAPGVGTAAPARCPQLVDPAGDQNPVTDPAADLLGVALGWRGSTGTSLGTSTTAGWPAGRSS
jgi:hypothetical protein